jgi:hypothetical protein
MVLDDHCARPAKHARSRLRGEPRARYGGFQGALGCRGLSKLSPELCGITALFAASAYAARSWWRRRCLPLGRSVPLSDDACPPSCLVSCW